MLLTNYLLIPIFLLSNLKAQELEENFEDEAETGKRLTFWDRLVKAGLS